MPWPILIVLVLLLGAMFCLLFAFAAMLFEAEVRPLVSAWRSDRRVRRDAQQAAYDPNEEARQSGSLG